MKCLLAGLRRAVAMGVLLSSTYVLSCGSTQQPGPQPEETDPDETPEQPCAPGCERGFCDVARNECVECLDDAACQDDARCRDGACVELACAPGTTRCADNRRSVLSCSGDGASEDSTDCPVDAPCHEGEDGALCEGWVCVPNSFRCEEGALFICSDEGTESTLLHECEAGEYCDDRRAVCLPRVCTPGEKVCDGAVLQVCNDAGSDLTDETTCSLSEECTPSGCKALLCVPNTTFCHESNVWQCGADATSSEMVEQCGSSRYCVEQNGAAVCSDHVCYPGDPICDGDVATTCKPDGSGPKPGGESCSAVDQVCYAGTCRDQVCAPGTKVCDHENVYLCADNGTDTELFKTCLSHEFCDPASGACRARVCTPGLVGCSGTLVATCNADGSAFESGAVDCADTGKVCEAGSCLPKVCEPYEYVCVDNGVANCNGSGSAYGDPQPCYEGSYCLQSGTSGSCVATVCDPGEPACDHNRVSICNDIGSGALPGDLNSDCGAQVCDRGACKPKVCEPDALLCGSGHVQRCSATGASFELYQYCLSDTYCHEVDATTAECRTKPCVPGVVGCLGEGYGECAASGLSLEPGATDCAQSGEVCTAQGCASAAVEAVGAPTHILTSFGDLQFDRVRVVTTRKLTQIEAYLTLPADRQLRWVIYRPGGVLYQYNWTVTFDRVTIANGSQYHSSGPMSFQLEAGKEYLIGVQVSGGSYVRYVSDPGVHQQALSFGQATGGGYGTFAAEIYPSFELGLRPLRLTTALP